jgi:hypothetical protein
MFPSIPDDAIEFTRNAFAQANAKVSMLLLRQPSIHEESLDFHLIASLDEIGPHLMPDSQAAVEIQTHWLGGRRHFGNWEIADIALVVIVRTAGVLVARKVALLQSKRLYSREIPVSTLDRSDYEIGIGRLIDRIEPLVPLSTRRAFSFSDACVYGAMTAGSDQVRRIEQYQDERKIPVYYTLYNPPRMPFEGFIPRLVDEPEDRRIDLGCRVITATDAHAILSALPVGKPPSFAELVASSRSIDSKVHEPRGWRLEGFVADDVLRCRQGRVFDDAQDEDLATLLYRRSAPITAAVVIAIELPGKPDAKTQRRALQL